MVATAGCAYSAQVPFLPTVQRAPQEAVPPERPGEPHGSPGSLITGALAVPGRAPHSAVTQPGERLTDGTVSMPRTPLNFPHGRQMKLPLYFATLQVTETQLPLPLPRFHPPEFRRRPSLSELPGLFSLLSPRGEPAGASHCPCSLELTYLNVSALPGRPWCRSPRPPCWVF